MNLERVAVSFYSSTRARYRGLSRHKSSRAASFFHERFSEDADNKALLFSGLGGVITAIPNPSSVSKPTSDSPITGFSALASYCWLDSPRPKIVVPGGAYMHSQ